MKHITTLVILLWSVGLIAQAQVIALTPTLEQVAPEDMGMSSARLERIDAMCKAAIADNQVPGIVALVARHGKIVFHRAYGSTDNQTNRAAKTDDIFRIASQTKAITSTAVMMLWEEGLFQLDDPIEKYIPAFAEAVVLDSVMEDGTYTTVPAKNKITIRHLITHTSGLGYGVIDGNATIKKIYADAGVTDLFTTEDISIEESVLKLAKLPLHHEPGERFTYSEGLDVLGYFVELMSGMPLDEFFKTRIFEPLGMDDTWFYLPESKQDRLVSVQRNGDNGWERYPVTFYDTDYPKTGARRFFSGGAGLSSTAKDYATFLQMYLNNGMLNGHRLLSRTTISIIMANQIGDIWGDGPSHHGLAFSVIRDKGEALGGKGTAGTFEWGGYFNTQYFADPQEGIIGVLLKQTQGPVADETAWKFRQLVGAAVDD